MGDFRLQVVGQTADLDLSGHRFNLVTGDDAIEQHLRIRLRFFLGEWFLDARVGIPYFRDILVRNPNSALIRNIYRTTILDTPGIKSLESLELNIDTAARTLSLWFSCTLDSGAVITYAPFILEL